MHDTEYNYKQERQLQHMIAVRYGLRRAGITYPCTTRPEYSGDSLSKLYNPPMTAAWIDKPCLN